MQVTPEIILIRKIYVLNDMRHLFAFFKFKSEVNVI